VSNVISVSMDGAGEELRSFQEWLREEPEVRRHAVISLEAAEPAGAGEMGGALDVVKLVIDTGFQILNFGLAYVSWRASRPRPIAVTVERDGVKITLDDSDPEVIARLVRALDG
jgi:Effector Associated Constant Component 1